MRRRLGILGGTFDPFHVGHLDAADAARAALSLNDVLFVPSHDPPHRSAEPHASAFHRFALVALAIADEPRYHASDIELLRQGRSYTSDTLAALHASGWSRLQLFFIIGADAFAEIATWHRFPAVLDAANFVVIARPGASIDAATAQVPDLRSRLRRTTAGVGANEKTAIYLVHAHTRDVSSTIIRTRLAEGRSIDDLVPIPVARHIAAHHLYGTDNNLHGDNKGN
jgi:nicotinate-nucleotide adenylyltransferase